MTKDKKGHGSEKGHFYHGTSHERAAQILKSGLQPGKSLHDSQIFMTTSHATAQKYSKDTKGRLGAVLKIEKQAVKPSKMAPSPESGVVRYKASIDPKHISKV